MRATFVHRRPRAPGKLDERGIALITVLVLTFVLTLAAASYFAMSWYETRQATYRQESAEAFYLADGAVERGRAELFRTALYRGSILGDSLGNGTYDLFVEDSTYAGKPAVFIRGVGHVGRADRAVEAFAYVRPPMPPFLVMRNLDGSTGSLCLGGAAHANGDADFGNNEDGHFQSGGCDLEGSYTEGFEILPPVVFTEPSRYPNSTYYWVSVIAAVPPVVRIWKHVAGDTLDITDSLSVHHGVDLADHLTGVVEPFQFEFDTPELQTLFDPSGSVFSRDPGDNAVIVNFAPWVGAAQVDVEFQDSGTNPITATIINSRFTGVTLEDRWNWRFWNGGTIRCKTKTSFEPANGLAMIAYNFDPSNAQVTLGTPDDPALTYVCLDVVRFNGGLEVHGALIVLRDYHSNGNVTVEFHEGLLERLPVYLQETFQPGTGIAEYLVWREVAAGT